MLSGIMEENDNLKASLARCRMSDFSMQPSRLRPAFAITYFSSFSDTLATSALALGAPCWRRCYKMPQLAQTNSGFRCSPTRSRYART